jgi:hypothetical protein
MNGMKQTENTNLLYSSTKCKDKFILAFGENEIELELFLYGMKLAAENMQYLKGD